MNISNIHGYQSTRELLGEDIYNELQSRVSPEMKKFGLELKTRILSGPQPTAKELEKVEETGVLAELIKGTTLPSLLWKRVKPAVGTAFAYGCALAKKSMVPKSLLMSPSEDTSSENYFDHVPEPVIGLIMGHLEATDQLKFALTHKRGCRVFLKLNSTDLTAIDKLPLLVAMTKLMGKRNLTYPLAEDQSPLKRWGMAQVLKAHTALSKQACIQFKAQNSVWDLDGSVQSGLPLIEQVLESIEQSVKNPQIGSDLLWRMNTVKYGWYAADQIRPIRDDIVSLADFIRELRTRTESIEESQSLAAAQDRLLAVIHPLTIAMTQHKVDLKWLD